MTDLAQTASRPRRWSREALRVLLVEDDDGDAILVGELLRTAAPMQVDRVRSLAAAEGWLRSGAIDCVLLDLGLPDASGLEAISRMLALDADIALVVLTGDSDEQRGIEALSGGAQDYLVKGRIDASSLLRSIRYAMERKSSERSRQELALARVHAAENSRLQRGLLPEPIVDDPRIAVAAAYRPGLGRMLVGGDFYDVVQDRGGRIHAVVGDVCGHGPDEAALGVRMRMAWRTLTLAGVPEDELLATLDRVLVHERERPGLFTTLATISIDLGCCSARVRLAGHPPPALVADGRTRLLDGCARGPVLGVSLTPSWPVTEIELEAAWTLVLYTDGLYEGRIGTGPARLGTDGLLTLLAALDLRPRDDVAGKLERLIGDVERLNDGSLTDDVAIVVLSCDVDG